MDNEGGSITVRTVCNHSDALFCGIQAHVTKGVITRVSAADFPDRADEGICAKGLATSQLAYHPDRLKYPLKRVGERGEGKWQRISWDEALDNISHELQAVARRHGSTSVAWDVLPIGRIQWTGYAQLAGLTRGTWVSVIGFGDSAGPCADIAAFGQLWSDRYLCLVDDPKFSIVWGHNPALTDFHRMRRIMEDKKKGCRLVVIDPRLTSTAARADEYIPIRPGTDGALALAMIHVILEQGLQDERFITESTVGPLLVRNDNGLLLRESDLIEGGSQQIFMVFDQNTGQVQPCDTAGIKPALTGEYLVAGIKCRPVYRLLTDIVREKYAPERVSGITDIPADVIRQLAVDYATLKPAVIHRGMGMQRSFYSDLTWQAISTLAAISGNIYPQQLPPLPMLSGEINMIPIMMLYDAITKGEPSTIKAVWFARQNFINQLPNMNKIISELLPQLELIVVPDLFMTTTARYADYVLPAATFFECMDLHTNGNNNINTSYIQLQQKVIEPLHESKSDFQIAAELGRRMGFGEYFNKSEEQYLEELLSSGDPMFEGATLQRLKEGPMLAEKQGDPGKFRTITGRIEFYQERLKQFGQELPVYMEPVESNRSEKARIYPLSLLTTHARHRSHSTFANIPSLRSLDPEPAVEINPVDAEARNISDGDTVCVFNDRGQVKLKAKITHRIKPGVVNIEQGWWPEDYIEGHHQQLTHDRINPAQQTIFEPNAALHDALVEVKNVG